MRKQYFLILPVLFFLAYRFYLSLIVLGLNSTYPGDSNLYIQVLNMTELPTDMTLIFDLEESQKKMLVDMCITGKLQAFIKLEQQKPKVQKISEDVPPGSEPVLEYIEDLEQRQRIFEKFHRFQIEYSCSDKLNMAAFGVIMVAPIHYLEEYLDRIRICARTGDQDAVAAWFASFLYRCQGILAYANRGGQPSCLSSAHSSAQYMPASTLGNSRNELVSQLCKLRDHNECILTGTSHPEAAHIFPYGTLKHAYFTMFEGLIKTFWGEQAKVWMDLIKDASITESARNLLSLNHRIHWWFDNGNLALKPLRQLADGSVIVQLHWLKRHQIKSTATWEGTIDELMQRAGLEDNSAWGEMLAYKKDGLPLKTGQIFTLKADKPELVPSFELLKLSWDMLRIIAISGAAEPKELWKDDGYLNPWVNEVSLD
ncbi:hypothetical protein ACQKWADRAFT_290374 [Trichoderma austrokoningii]